MKAPALRKPAPQHIRTDATESIVYDPGPCPFACLDHHKAVYYRRAVSANDVAATICNLCDSAYTRTQLLTLFTDVGSGPDAP